MHRLTDQDWQGHDNYERVAGGQRMEHGVNYEKVDRGSIFGEYSPYEQVGRVSTHGMGGGPFDVPQLPSVIDVLYEGPVRYVGITHKQPVINLLEYLSFTPDSPQGSDPLNGHAVVVAFSLGQHWVTDLVADGYVVMIKWPVDPMQMVSVIASKTPSVIAHYATDAGGYMIVDGPQALIVSAGGTAQAAQQGQPGVTPGATPGATPGTTTNGAGPLPGTSVVVSSSGMPGWVLPVVIGVGALGILALVSMAKSRTPRSSYAMNLTKRTREKLARARRASARRRKQSIRRNGRKARRAHRAKIGI